MEFIDHTGHIFSLQHFNNYPNGYNYDEQPYVFWLDDELNTSLSIDCYYIKPIKMLINKKDIKKIGLCEISIEESNNFSLISPIKVQRLIDNNTISNIFNEIELSEKTDLVKKISYDPQNKHDDLLIIDNIIEKKYYYINPSDRKKYVLVGEPEIDNNGKEKLTDVYIPNLELTVDLKVEENEYYLIPFYVIGNTSQEGTWLTNVLIHIKDIDDSLEMYCPITVGGEFTDECEELQINGTNMGITLPKDIIRSVYQGSFYNDTPNFAVYNQKIKEYLLNYMKLHGERGNFRSAIYGLKWFGYGDKLEISKLLQTDNEFVNQFILNKFEIDSDVIESFKKFRNSTYLSLSLKYNDYTNKDDIIDFKKELWGEGKPIYEDLFSKVVYNTYDENDIKFYKPYYDFAFNELGLKLAALKYYYQKYFLPVHLKIHRLSITEQCFANDVKLLSKTIVHRTEPLVHVYDNNLNVEFPENILWVNYQEHFVDQNFNEFTNTYNEGLTLNRKVYEIKDTCFCIPIKFSSNKEIYNCNLYLYKDNNCVIDTKFRFIQTYELDENNNKIYNNRYENLVVYPKVLNKNLENNFWLDSKYKLLLLVNDTWFEYNFTLKFPELDIKLGKLKYKYDYNVCKQFNSLKNENGKAIIDWNAHMYLPDLISVNNINYINNLIDYMNLQNLQFISEDEINKLDIIYYYFYDRQGIKRIISSNEYELVDVNHNGIYKKAVNYTVQEIINENNLFYILDEDENKINTMKNAEKYLVHSSVVKNINSFINFYSTDINIPYNKYLYNRIHLLDLFVYKNDELVQLQYNVNDYEDEAFMEIKINNKIYKIGQNTSEDIYELYNKIFDENGDWTSKLYGIKKSIDDIVFTQNEQNEYDFYLMHDTEYWYGIMISKHTINSLNLYDLPYKTYRMNFHDTSVNNEVLKENMIYLKLNKSNDIFLINRMEFIDCNGINQFNNNDFVAAKIINNDRLPIKSELDSKWTIKPLSIGIDNFEEFKSNTNMMLMSIGDNLKYEPGYYEIIVKYSIDNFTNEIYSKSTKFKIIK